MQPIIFQNDEETQKVIVITKTNDENGEDEIDFHVEFQPVLGEQDKDSLHFILATHFINSIAS